MSFFIETLRETTLGPVILLAGLAGLALAAVALALSIKRGGRVRRLLLAAEGAPDTAAPLAFSTWAEMLAVVSALLAPVAAVVGTSMARAEVVQAIFQPDPSQKATFLAAGIGGQINTIALGALLVLLQLALAAAALALGLVFRSQAKGVNHALQLKRGGELEEADALLARPGVRVHRGLVAGLGFALLGVYPMVYGVHKWALGTITGFAGVAGVDPSQKAVLLLEAMKEARQTLDHCTLAAGIGLAVAVVLAAAMLGRGSRGPSNRATVIMAVGCLLGAGLCVGLAWSYRQENLDPIPVNTKPQPVLASHEGLGVPDLVGPDEVPWAPSLDVTRSGTAILDGAEVDHQRLKEQLAIKRHNYLLVNPDRDFPGELVLQADRTVSMSTILPLLGAAKEARFTNLVLAFKKERVIQRARLGRLTHQSTSGAKVRLDQGASKVEGTYATWAASVVKARKAGQEVVLSTP